MNERASKSAILERIRRRELPVAPLPDLNRPWITYVDREKQFADVLASVGGSLLACVDRSQLESTLQQLPCFAGAQKIICSVSGLSLGNCDLRQVADPHELADVDVAIVAGEFAVAENGAVWVNGRPLKHRSLCCITQHLVLVLPRSEIVDTMHQAYERLKFDETGYGLFISGPSKTADIEQSLVIGAHGARSLSVALTT